MKLLLPTGTSSVKLPYVYASHSPPKKTLLILLVTISSSLPPPNQMITECPGGAWLPRGAETPVLHLIIEGR